MNDEDNNEFKSDVKQNNTKKEIMIISVDINKQLKSICHLTSRLILVEYGETKSLNKNKIEINYEKMGQFYPQKSPRWGTRNCAQLAVFSMRYYELVCGLIFTNCFNDDYFFQLFFIVIHFCHGFRLNYSILF